MQQSAVARPSSRFGFADGKEDEGKSFNCYPSGTAVLTQLGVLRKLEAVLR
jgi:hypothetical protein